MDFVEANDVMLAYEIFEAQGPRHAPPLILMRGLGTQMIQWHRPLIDSFTAHGMDVVIFDNRDVGRSTSWMRPAFPIFRHWRRPPRSAPCFRCPIRWMIWPAMWSA